MPYLTPARERGPVLPPPPIIALRRYLTPVREAGGGGGHWVTINSDDEGGGTHIFISGSGSITKGPASLVGHHIGAVASHHSAKPVKHHPEGHVPPGAMEHPSYTEKKAEAQPEGAQQEKVKNPGKPYARLHGADQGEKDSRKTQVGEAIQKAQTEAKAAADPAKKLADAAVAHDAAKTALHQHRATADKYANPYAPHLSPPVDDEKDRALSEKATRAEVAHQAAQQRYATPKPAKGKAETPAAKKAEPEKDAKATGTGTGRFDVYTGKEFTQAELDAHQAESYKASIERDVRHHTGKTAKELRWVAHNMDATAAQQEATNGDPTLYGYHTPQTHRETAGRLRAMADEQDKQTLRGQETNRDLEAKATPAPAAPTTRTPAVAPAPTASGQPERAGAVGTPVPATKAEPMTRFQRHQAENAERDRIASGQLAKLKASEIQAPSSEDEAFHRATSDFEKGVGHPDSYRGSEFQRQRDRAFEGVRAMAAQNGHAADLNDVKHAFQADGVDWTEVTTPEQARAAMHHAMSVHSAKIASNDPQAEFHRSKLDKATALLTPAERKRKVRETSSIGRYLTPAAR